MSAGGWRSQYFLSRSLLCRGVRWRAGTGSGNSGPLELTQSCVSRLQRSGWTIPVRASHALAGPRPREFRVTQLASTIYDAIDFSQADDGIRRIGVFLAWAVNHRLLSERLEREASTAVARVRFRDLAGSEMLTMACHGELARQHLSDAGNAFAERYYNHGYLDAYAAAVADERASGASHEALTSLDGEWALYDHLAPAITRAHRGPRTPDPAPQTPPSKARAPWLRLVK